VDGVIAPVFPSNTARSGVLYPLVAGLAAAGGASPDNPARRKLGGYLMFSGMVSLSLSSALWFTAMAGNPIGAELARHAGVEIGFGSWLLASSVPTLAAMLVLPWLLQRVMSPEVSSTPDAPAAAKRALASLGPLSRDERIVAGTFLVMAILWASAVFFRLDPTAIAFLGLGVLLATGVLTTGDLLKEGDVLATFIWFAVLLALSGQLNDMGFMGYVGQRLAGALGGLGPIAVYLILVPVYALLRYLFVSPTAHVLALFALFLDMGVQLGAAAAPLAFMLLFASSFVSIITPQGAAANLLFAGSGYFSQRELYRLGAITTAISLAIYLVLGTPWLMFVA